MNRQPLLGKKDDGEFYEKNVQRDESKPISQSMSQTLCGRRILCYHQHDVDFLSRSKSFSKYPDDFD